MTENPYHARSAPDGRFEIPDVPPGKWTLRVWHERLGEFRIPVDVQAGRILDLGSVIFP